MCPFVRVFAATAILVLLVPRVQAQHLYWDLQGQKDATCLYGTITVLATHPGLYYSGACWAPATGYCGIQHHAKERRTIFSIWETSPQLHAKSTQADPDTICHGFSGEGEGEHTSRVWPWKVGETFEFFLQKENIADGKSTDARYYVYDRGSKRWRHISTIRSPIGGQKGVETLGDSIASFLENFLGKDKEVPKLALYRLWLGKSVDGMRPLTKAGGDGIWGQLDDTYFLAEGAEKRLDAVFRGLEGKYGKPLYARKGEKLPPITTKPIPAEVVMALKDLPRAEAVGQRSDDPRDNRKFLIRSVSARKGVVIGRDGKAYQLAVSKARVVWGLKQVGDDYLIIDTANGLALDGSANQLTLKSPTGSAGQLWSFERAGDGYHIRCKETKRVLDLAGGERDGTPIVTWELKKPPEDWNQLWMLTEVKK
jgi:hypothetical protein